MRMVLAALLIVALAGPILSHFDFNNPHYDTVLLNPTTGEVTGKKSGK